MENYPEKLVNVVNEYLKKYEGAEIFYKDCYTSTPYQNKTITDTTYKIYILWGNLFEVFSYTVCSKPEYNFKEVKNNFMIAQEIKDCYEKSGFFK